MLLSGLKMITTGGIQKRFKKGELFVIRGCAAPKVIRYIVGKVGGLRLQRLITVNDLRVFTS
jgi:hypothetical protein